MSVLIYHVHVSGDFQKKIHAMEVVPWAAEQKVVGSNPACVSSFFSSSFLFSVSFFSLLLSFLPTWILSFFLHAHSATSMLKHSSSNKACNSHSDSIDGKIKLNVQVLDILQCVRSKE